MKSGHVFVGLWAIVAVCIVFAGCNPSSYGGGGGGGGNPTPTPPIPAGDYYVNSGQNPNQVYAFSTAPIASNGQPSGLTGQPYSTTRMGQTGAQFGMAFALSDAVLYVSNYDDNSISIFPVNADGSLGAPATKAAGSGPAGICVDPTSAFLVVVNAAANTIQSFTIGAAGALTLVTTTPTTDLTSPVDCAFSTDSKTVYVSNNANPGGVTAFTVGAGATLTLLNTWPLATDTFQGIVATSGAVFAATQGGNGVGAYQTAAGGNLIPQAVTPTAFGPIGLALSPNGKYLYVAAAAKQAVDAYAINGVALTQLTGAPYQVLTNGLSYVSVNSAGTLLVALDVVDHAVTPFAITSTGTLGYPPQAEYVYGAAGNPKAIIAR